MDGLAGVGVGADVNVDVSVGVDADVDVDVEGVPFHRRCRRDRMETRSCSRPAS